MPDLPYFFEDRDTVLVKTKPLQRCVQAILIRVKLAGNGLLLQLVVVIDDVVRSNV